MTRRGRPPKGSLYLGATGWRARVTVTIDGERVRKAFDLGTSNKSAARLKLKRLLDVEAPTPAEAARVETFREAALRIVEASKIRTTAQRKARLEHHVFEHLGDKSVDEVTASDVREVLATVAGAGLSRQLCTHVKNDISAVLGELWRNEVISENVVAKVRVPDAKVDTRERAVLTDAELVLYLSWEHPDPKWRADTLERQTMACVSRMFGGLRHGDVLALRWESFDVTDGRFEHGWAPRKKTARPQLLEVPEMLRPILRDWWERHGRPRSGLIFATRHGERAGEERVGASVARAFRRDLRRALGIDEPQRVELMRRNGRRDVRIEFKPARPLTPRERELFEETEFTKPVDFHSFRRAFKQALADAGVELTTAMSLSGASDVKAHQRYLANTSKMRRVPVEALPTFAMVRAETPDAGLRNPPNSQCRRVDLNHRPEAYEASALTD
jgi:integrase